MKTRINTIYGMATKQQNNDTEFVKLIFDNKVALNGSISCNEWIVSKTKLKRLLKEV